MKRIGLPWSAMCRADTVKPETWQAMKDAGCFGVKLGFETGSQRVINEIINKKLDLKEAAKPPVSAFNRHDDSRHIHGGYARRDRGRKTDDLSFHKGALRHGSNRLAPTERNRSDRGSPMALLMHNQEALERYPGANPENYSPLTDGQLGIEQARALPPSATFTD